MNNTPESFDIKILILLDNPCGAPLSKGASVIAREDGDGYAVYADGYDYPWRIRLDDAAVES